MHKFTHQQQLQEQQPAGNAQKRVRVRYLSLLFVVGGYK